MIDIAIEVFLLAWITLLLTPRDWHDPRLRNRTWIVRDMRGPSYDSLCWGCPRGRWW